MEWVLFVMYMMQVLSEFTHGKEDKVSKSEFKEVLSDILLGMAAGLKRDPIVILRIDGEDLEEFINGPAFESEMISIYSQIDLPEGSSVKDYIVKALEKLSVDQGMPPSSDPWVSLLPQSNCGQFSVDIGRGLRRKRIVKSNTITCACL